MLLPYAVEGMEDLIEVLEVDAAGEEEMRSRQQEEMERHRDFL
jgi:hypothetical protein